MLRNHCDTLHASDFLGEIPNPCDGGISKRTWESQVMLCRQKLREFKQGHDDQGGSSDDKQGGASSDDDDEGEEPAEPRFVIDDEGQITFQDIINDSLEEEVHAFMAEIEHNNIRKMHGAYCCPFCPFRAFGRLCQLSDHLRRHHVAAKQFVCSGKKQVKVILALHDSDSVRKENGADYLFRSAVLLRTQVVPPLDRNKNFIDKSLRLLLEKDGPRYVNQKALGEQIVARRVLNIYYGKLSCTIRAFLGSSRTCTCNVIVLTCVRAGSYFFAVSTMPWNDVHSSILRSRAFGLVYICGLWKPATCLGTCTLPIHVIGGLLWRTSTCPIKSKA